VFSALATSLLADGYFCSALKRELQTATSREIELNARVEQNQKQREDAEEKNVRATNLFHSSFLFYEQHTLLRDIDANQRDVEGMVKSIESLEKTLQQYKQREVRCA